MKIRGAFALLLGLSVLCGCRSTYYSAMETFGVYKRDLLKKKVVAARDEQQTAQEQFKDALTRLKELSGFEGGELEEAYNGLKRDYDRSVDRARAVKKRIEQVETVAEDLFAEWKKEIGEISTASLRNASEKQLQETRRRYEDLHSALTRAAASMDPVLVQFKDQVLFLKHNLNAAAIASLKGETSSIQAEITKLIQEMNTAIAEADKFISAMP